MLRRNPNFAKLKTGYLFPEIEKRVRAFRENHPDIPLTNLGIGDTSRPLPQIVADAMAAQALAMATPDGYKGYGPEEGIEELRSRISRSLYNDAFQSDEIFISDGAGSDIGRLLALFGSGLKVGVQDPVYPAFVDGNLLMGAQEIVFLPCIPENHFFPDLSRAKECSILYICYPNNPTGAHATHSQLQELITFAKQNHILIVFDAAYAPFVKDDTMPHTIFDIPGAREVAIEIGSFSKLAGFTGVRLGWTVVPKELQWACGSSIRADWRRLVQTFFNGPSRLSQAGGLAALTPAGLQAIDSNISYYLNNAQALKKRFTALTSAVYGADHSPYVWAHFPGRSSWDLFEELLSEHHLITIPGSGFGPSGESFIRLSAFGLCCRDINKNQY